MATAGEFLRNPFPFDQPYRVGGGRAWVSLLGSLSQEEVKILEADGVRVTLPLGGTTNLSFPLDYPAERREKEFSGRFEDTHFKWVHLEGKRWTLDVPTGGRAVRGPLGDSSIHSSPRCLLIGGKFAGRVC